MKQTFSGSITVFMALLLTMFFSVVFAFLEAGRVSALKTNAQLYSMQAGDGLLSEYHPGIWKDYKLLFWQAGESDTVDIQRVGSRQMELLLGNTVENKRENTYFLGLSIQNIALERYRLATDFNGAEFRKQAAKAVKESVTSDFIKRWENGSKVDYKDGKKLEDRLDQTLKELKKQKKKSSDSTKEEKPKDVKQIKDNPIKWIKKIKKQGILGIVMPDKKVSKKQLKGKILNGRNCSKGTFSAGESVSKTEEVLFRYYLGRHFTNAAAKNTQRALQYEMEFLISGKKEDQKNLKSVVHRLLAMREVVNYGYLQKDIKKQKDASAVALALSSAIANPELEPVFKQIILLAWAYAESLSDVKILLAGGKVLPIKTEKQWHTDIYHLSSGGGKQGKKQKKGLSYVEYLQLLLATVREKQIAFRALTLIGNQEKVSMDHMISKFDCRYHYTGSRLFWNFVRIGGKQPKEYCFTNQHVFGYQ